MRILKPVGYLLPAMVVSLVGAYAFLSRDVAATHPELTISALPDLIPAREFFANQNAEWAYLPSADGTMIAWYGVEWAKTVIHIRRTEEQKPFLTLSGEQFGDFRWDAFGGSLILAVEGRLWRVDVAHPERDRWVDITPRGFGSWRIITSPKTPEDQIVIASNDRDAALYDLYTVRQDGGGKQLLERNSGKTIDWWFDAKGVPRIRVDRVEHDAARYFIRREVDSPWRVLTEASARDNFELLFAPGNGDLIYALSDRGRDRIALTSVDAQTGEETVLADHPNVDARRSFTFASNATKPDFISFESSSREYRAFSSYGENFLKLMLDGDNPVDFSTLGSSADGRFVTVARSWREQSHEYFLYDLRDATATKIAEFDLRQYKNIFAETKAVSLGSDGLEIAAFLTLPHAVAPKNLPAIVLIHGGPASQTFWSFSEDVQFLANRGYAVLSVNFRGSTGYGKRFREAGYGQVGKAMQDDIVDAAKWLVAQGIADKDNMAVMGGSYGGYSAALAITATLDCSRRRSPNTACSISLTRCRTTRSRGNSTSTK